MMRSRILTPTKGKAILCNYDWAYLLVFLFKLEEKASDAEAELKRWIEWEAEDWCNDDDYVEGGRPSYILMGTRENRIQGPAFYMLIAGVTDELQNSVRSWNETSGRTCTSIRFQAFRGKAHLRRKAVAKFLSGLLDLNCLVWHDVD